jgi:hypothetical protein
VLPMSVSRRTRLSRLEAFAKFGPGVLYIFSTVYYFIMWTSVADPWHVGMDPDPVLFFMMIEGSGAGSIPLTNGSGFGRPKNMWIRIRIWIRNTDVDSIVIDIGHVPWGKSAVEYFSKLSC